MKKEKEKSKLGRLRLVGKTYVNIQPQVRRERSISWSRFTSIDEEVRRTVGAKRKSNQADPQISALNRQMTLAHSQSRRQRSELILVINP